MGIYRKYKVSNLPRISPVQSKISNEHERNVGIENSKVTKSQAVQSLRPNTTQPSGNNKYTRRTYAPATTPILKSPHIDDNFHSQNSSSVSKLTNNNNNNCHEDWIYNVIQFVNLLCLLKLLSQQNTSRNDIVIYSYSDTLSTFNNTIQYQSSFKIKRDHHISHIKPESTAFFTYIHFNYAISIPQ